MFSLSPVQSQASFQGITHLQTNNDILTIAFKDKIYRIDLNDPAIIDNIPLQNISNIFQDPTGTHLLILTSTLETYYLNKESTSLKIINELKNIKITAVAWSDNSLLIGDSKGHIHELTLKYHNNKLSKKLSKQLYKASSAIDGIQVVTINGKFTVLLVAGDDIVYWYDSQLSSVFTSKPIEFEKFQNLGFINGDKFVSNGTSLAWLTLDGIVFGDLSEESISTKKSISNLKFIINSQFEQSTHKFKSVSLTKYHLILLRHSELIIINRINDDIVFNETLPIDSNERFIGVTSDFTKNTYWVYSNSNIYEINAEDEGKLIWKSFLEVEDFESALASTEDVNSRDIIYSKQGQYLFNKAKFAESASSFALSSLSFESIALKYLEISNDEALLQYFIDKFNNIKKNKNFQFKTQLVMLSSWIVELVIEKLNNIDDEILTSTNLEKLLISKADSEQFLQDFLVSNIEDVDRPTIYEIIKNHNRKSELLYYANLINDHEFVLKYWIRLENYDESLRTLSKLDSNDLIYKYSTVLFLYSPTKTVDTLLKIPDLDLTKLLSSILTYNKHFKKVTASKHEGIRFLSNYIKLNNVKTTTIHDTYLYLLISNESIENNEDLILTYLESSSGEILFNSDFILRLCLKFNKIKSASFIYSMLDFYEDAINLTIRHNMIDLSMVIADKPTDDDKLRKFLWLKIAKALFKDIKPDDNETIKNKIKLLLNKCELLTIKDLLPIIPDFIVIDNLKDEICQDLEKFGNLVNQISTEMNNSMVLNKEILESISANQEKHTIIKAGESCSICDFLLISRKFFIYPCNHSFHSDCLIKHILKSNDYSTRKKLEFLQRNFIKNNTNKSNKFINDEKVDQLLTQKCPLCTDFKIETIDEPFTSNSNEWEI